MLLWIFMAALTAVASLAILVPLGRQRSVEAADASARSIYRDQLDELARDRERGLIADAEAEAARIEVARRLLKTEGEAAPVLPATFARKAAILAAAILLPLIAVGTYLAVGSPNLDDQPLATRTLAKGGDQELAALIVKVEQHLATNPEDGKGWEVLGPVYMQQGRFDDAVRAFDNARRLLGATAEREAQLGEAITKAHGGVVTLDAKAAFDRALAAEPDNVRALFYQALSLGQSGQKEAAITAWQTLVAKSPADAPWLVPARAELARLGVSAPPAPATPGPTTADMADAAAKSPAERQAMIEGMVSGLATRLDGAPDDVGGWARLFRAYMVLGRPGDAEAALARARSALAGKPELLAAVEQAAVENGIGQNGAAQNDIGKEKASP